MAATKKQPLYSVPVYKNRRQLEGWSPYHNKTGGPPPQPPAIGAAPLGGPNPRFPSVGPSHMSPPPGGYQSIISTQPGIDRGLVDQLTRTPKAFRSDSLAAGDQTRSVFSRALADNTNAELKKSAMDFNQTMQQQAFKSRAEDILQQRQNAADTFRMNVSNAVSAKDIWTGYDIGSKDLMQGYWTERWNQEAERTAIALRFASMFF